MRSPLAFLRYRLYRLQRRYYAKFDPVKFTQLLYKEAIGEYPDLKNPKTLNEKILWLKLHSDTSRWSLLADKLRVREYVAQCGLKETLNDLYAHWKSAHEIDFNDPRLPKSVVLKTNHGCGDVCIVRDKTQIDTHRLRKKLHTALKLCYGAKTAEPHYQGINRHILAERLLPNDSPYGCSLIDYKFYCFNGEPRYCLVCYDRKTHRNFKTELHDSHTWEDLSRYLTIGQYYQPSQPRIPRPASLEQMLDIARRLSRDIPMVRVDLYEVEKQPIFGEMTLTPGAGISTKFTPEFQKIMGSQLALPPKRRLSQRNKF